jgi:hypothetical protein
MLHDLTLGQDTETVPREMKRHIRFRCTFTRYRRSFQVDDRNPTVVVDFKSCYGTQPAQPRHSSLSGSRYVRWRFFRSRCCRCDLAFRCHQVGEKPRRADGGLYQAGYGMAAIIGLSESQISSIIVTIGSQPVFVSNLNAPRQIVVVGFVRAIEEVLARARALGARRTELLRVSVPSHCPLMESVAYSLDQQLQDMEVRDPKCVYI